MVRTTVHFNLPHLVTRKLSRHSGGKHTCPLCFPSFSDKKASSPNLPAGGNWKAHLPNVFLPQNIFVIITPFITLRLVRGFFLAIVRLFSQNIMASRWSTEKDLSRRLFLKQQGPVPDIAFPKWRRIKNGGDGVQNVCTLTVWTSTIVHQHQYST